MLQVVEVVEKRKRDSKLMDLLEDYHGALRCKSKVIIFCLYKKEAEHVYKLLKNTVCMSLVPCSSVEGGSGGGGGGGSANIYN